MAKRILAVILALTMVLSLFSVEMFAADPVYSQMFNTTGSGWRNTGMDFSIKDLGDDYTIVYTAKGDFGKAEWYEIGFNADTPINLKNDLVFSGATSTKTVAEIKEATENSSWHQIFVNSGDTVLSDTTITVEAYAPGADEPVNSQTYSPAGSGWMGVNMEFEISKMDDDYIIVYTVTGDLLKAGWYQIGFNADTSLNLKDDLSYTASCTKTVAEINEASGNSSWYQIFINSGDTVLNDTTIIVEAYAPESDEEVPFIPDEHEAPDGYDEEWKYLPTKEVVLNGYTHSDSHSIDGAIHLDISSADFDNMVAVLSDPDMNAARLEFVVDDGKYIDWFGFQQRDMDTV